MRVLADLCFCTRIESADRAQGPSLGPRGPSGPFGDGAETQMLDIAKTLENQTPNPVAWPPKSEPWFLNSEAQSPKPEARPQIAQMSHWWTLWGDLGQGTRFWNKTAEKVIRLRSFRPNPRSPVWRGGGGVQRERG